VSSLGKLDIGVVGGSIAGCFVALELLAAGHRVTVFERSDAELHGMLGAGLGTPTPMFQMLVDRGLVDHNLPRVTLSEMLFVGRDPCGARHGRVALRRQLIFVAFHWSDLHRGLRARMPPASYRAGQHVDSVIQVGQTGAAVRLADGTEHQFDLVVCADGYLSQGRRALLATVEPEYHGYVCWRGVVEEDKVSDARGVGANFARFGTASLPGSFVYPIPGSDGAVTVGRRLINWGCYVPVASEGLADFLVGSDGSRYRGTIPPGEMRSEEERRLKTLARKSLPPLYADIVTESAATFAQAVYSVTVPAYHGGRICLTGDAGAVAPPFTGSGVFKAATNAIHLRTALDAHDDVDAALAEWGAGETTAADRLLQLGRQFDDAFIRNPPDFTTMEPDDAGDWWARSIQHPDGFTFEAAG
jgi:2-polyprenyl-6-methoxyphenol hydroxylase-like FAD-dependent oxidoreductase